MSRIRFSYRRFGVIALAAIPAVFAFAASRTAPENVAGQALPPGATRCDLSVPLSVELIPADVPRAGGRAHFVVTTDSKLDPDLVRASWVEYSVNRRVERPADAAGRRNLTAAQGRTRSEFDVPILDQTPHEVRARYVVQLVDGRTIAQTAIRWVDLGEPDLPEGMIARIEDRDGTGIRIYRGRTER